MEQAINLHDKLAAFDAHWTPHIFGRFNGHDLMLVKVLGEFVWHAHPETDDFFLVLAGELSIDLPDGAVVIRPGEVYVVPRGVQHRPRAAVETHLLLIEPAGTPNTGNPATAVVKVQI